MRSGEKKEWNKEKDIRSEKAEGRFKKQERGQAAGIDGDNDKQVLNLISKESQGEERKDEMERRDIRTEREKESSEGESRSRSQSNTAEHGPMTQHVCDGKLLTSVMLSMFMSVITTERPPSPAFLF